MVLADTRAVIVREETLVLPTYPPAPPDPNPMFLDKRANQGSSGRVYPNPITDRITGERIDAPYRAVILENEYIEVTLLPEIGGRIFAARDKTNGYDFLYRQSVIKPALIGLLGPWISGGIEFNFPLHHRPSTYMPVDYSIERGDDGSQTVWMSEHEPMTRMKGMVGICLHPAKSYVEAKVRVYNRTPMVQTFLWWANVAVHVNDEYQVIFPPDVTVVNDHAKRSMLNYPIARGQYGYYFGHDFGDGTDVSWYKNFPLPGSCFVNQTEYDFFGGYDHGKAAGIIYIGNHHISTGKKFFSWGTSAFAQAWERNLTDSDGPYIELMAGVYTDNQPDFSWLHPYETKTFSQIWYPIQQIGSVKNANRRAAVNLEVRDGSAHIGIGATERINAARITLTAGERVLWSQTADLAPNAPLLEQIALPPHVQPHELLLQVFTADDQLVIRYAPPPPRDVALPDVMTETPPPRDMPTVESLYLAGLHLEQYRHSTVSPEGYWLEALRRDPADARTNTALGRWYLRQGDFTRAETHLRQAVQTMTRWNPNPYEGEAYYYLGLALHYQARLDEAYSAYYKATWNYAWRSPAHYGLAEIDCRRDFAAALEHLDEALKTNTDHLKARSFKAALLRHLGRVSEAQGIISDTLALDPLHYGVRFEAVLLQRSLGNATAVAQAEQTLLRLVGSDAQTYLDIAFDYGRAELWREAADLLSLLFSQPINGTPPHPMAYYTLAHALRSLGAGEAADAFARQAAALPTDYCFPARLEEREVLQRAIEHNPQDSHAHLYLGNLLYDKHQFDAAIHHWEAATRLEPRLAPAWRNLGIAYHNVRRDMAQAKACYGMALEIAPHNGRVLLELDQLHKRLNTPPAQRLERLEKYAHLIRERDDLAVECARLYNRVGQPQKALDLLMSRSFHPWEGGLGMTIIPYIDAHLLLGRASLAAGDAATAAEHFSAALEHPVNLGEGDFVFDHHAQPYYWLGKAYTALGNGDAARKAYQRAADTTVQLSANTRRGVSVAAYYQALALAELGDAAASQHKLQTLLSLATEMRESEAMPMFSTSVDSVLYSENDLQHQQAMDSTYLMALAHLGMGNSDHAASLFRDVLDLNIDHLGAYEALKS